MRTRSKTINDFNFACIINDINTVKELIDLIDISIPFGKKFSRPFIMNDIIEQNSIELFQLLIEKGCDVDLKINGFTLLLRVCKEGKNEMANILIDNGADLNAHDNSFYDTPLMLATEEGNLELAKILINAGSDIESRNLFGFKAYDYDDNEKQRLVVKYIKKVKYWRKNKLVLLISYKSTSVFKNLPSDLMRYICIYLN